MCTSPPVLQARSQLALHSTALLGPPVLKHHETHTRTPLASPHPPTPRILLHPRAPLSPSSLLAHSTHNTCVPLAPLPRSPSSPSCASTLSSSSRTSVVSTAMRSPDRSVGLSSRRPRASAPAAALPPSPCRASSCSGSMGGRRLSQPVMRGRGRCAPALCIIWLETDGARLCVNGRCSTQQICNRARMHASAAPQISTEIPASTWWRGVGWSDTQHFVSARPACTHHVELPPLHHKHLQCAARGEGRQAGVGGDAAESSGKSWQSREGIVCAAHSKQTAALAILPPWPQGCCPAFHRAPEGTPSCMHEHGTGNPRPHATTQA